MLMRSGMVTVGRRRVGYAEYGCADGRPVMIFGGFPGSRFDGMLFAESAVNLGYRLISTDRPGFGQSDFQPGRRITDWPGDVAALTAALGIRKFPVLGLSAGAPYALACAAAMPESVERAVIVSGLAPVALPGNLVGMRDYTRLMICVARRFPWLLYPLLHAACRTLPSEPDTIIRRLLSTPNRYDREALERKTDGNAIKATVLAAFSQGPRGPWLESRLLVSPWNIAFEKVVTPVEVWHGAEDDITPPAMGRWLANACPPGRLTIQPAEGHYSLVLNHSAGILGSAGG